MNLRIGKIKNYNNKILVSSSSFSIGTNLKINLYDDKHIEKDKQDVKPNKPDIKSKKGDKQNIKIIKTKPDMNETTYEEEKAALILKTAIFRVWWIFKNNLFSSRFHHKICVDQNSNNCYKCPQILR